MASQINLQEDDIITGINVTPLVDVVLVLLVIFMVTASAIVGPSIKVDLPKASTGEETTPSTVSVVLSADGAIYLNGEASDDETILTKVRTDVAATPELQVVIAADRSTTHGRVVGFVDAVKAAGVTRFALSTEPTDLPDPAQEG